MTQEQSRLPYKSLGTFYQKELEIAAPKNHLDSEARRRIWFAQNTDIGIKILPISNVGFFVTTEGAVSLDISSRRIPMTVWKEFLRVILLPHLKVLSVDLVLVNSETSLFLSFLKRHANLEDLTITGTTTLIPGLFRSLSQSQASTEEVPLAELQRLRSCSAVLAEVLDSFQFPKLQTVIAEGGDLKDLTTVVTLLSTKWAQLSTKAARKNKDPDSCGKLIIELDPNALCNMQDQHENGEDAKGIRKEDEDRGKRGSGGNLKIYRFLTRAARRILSRARATPDVNNDAQGVEEIKQDGWDGQQQAAPTKIPFLMDLNLFSGRSLKHWSDGDCDSLSRWLKTMTFPNSDTPSLIITVERGVKDKTKLVERLSDDLKSSKVPYDIDRRTTRIRKEMLKNINMLYDEIHAEIRAKIAKEEQSVREYIICLILLRRWPIAGSTGIRCIEPASEPFAGDSPIQSESLNFEGGNMSTAGDSESAEATTGIRPIDSLEPAEAAMFTQPMASPGYLLPSSVVVEPEEISQGIPDSNLKAYSYSIMCDLMLEVVKST
ncbi:hypothetical protein C8R43DRAFT_1116552 [Mycena crocata]|nr:hypothetical protein C8R43DRAFT_1116552 [Mycena crocata]